MMQGDAARRVVVLDDAVAEIDELETIFTPAGFAIIRVPGADRAPEAAALEQAALIVLRVDTTACCDRLAALRRGGVLAPVVAIGAAADQTMVLSAFEAGADVFLNAPVDPAELLARCRALLRRNPAAAAREAVAGALQLDTQGRTASVGADRLDLSPMQFAVLEQLARRPGQVTTRRLLLDRLYDGVDTPAPSVIDFFIHALRRRLAACKSTMVIETVRGVGFRLTARGDLRGA